MSSTATIGAVPKTLHSAFTHCMNMAKAAMTMKVSTEQMMT